MAKKKAAKAAAPQAKSAPKGVEIVLLRAAHNEQPGDVRRVPKAQADTLVRRGHARYV